MAHNGIEYGMMQALAEGFAVMQVSDFGLDLVMVADVYNHKSVIESHSWTGCSLLLYGMVLRVRSNSVSGLRPIRAIRASSCRQ